MEALNLNRIPVGSNPVVHVSQYDVGRVFRFNLFDGSNVYTLDGTETIECNIRKLDGNVVTVGVTNTSSDYIDVVTTEQMTAIHGQNYGEIVFRKGGIVIGSVNFILQVEQSPLEGGITSDSAIYNLEVQVSNYVAIEVANQYDSANVIFDNTPVQGHGNGYTVTSEGIGTALDTKQDNITTKTASGDLIHITDGADNIPLKSCEVTINPDLSGKTECNLVVCGKNIFAGTLYNGQVGSNGGYNSNNTRISNVYGSEISKGALYLKSGSYTLSISGLDYCTVLTKDINNNIVDNLATSWHDLPYTFTLTNDVYLFFTARKSDNSNLTPSDYAPQLEVGNTATAYTPYNGTTYNIPFGTTVYGGSGNALTGEFESTFGFVEFDGSNDEDWHLSSTYDWNVYINIPISKPLQYGDMLLCKAGNNIVPTTPSGYIEENKCNISTNRNFQIGILGTLGITTLEDWRTWLSSNHIKVAFTLETPTSLTPTPVNPKTISGVNNIYNDCGSTEIEYFPNTVDGLVTLVKDFTVTDATQLPISDNDSTDTKSYIDGLTTVSDVSSQVSLAPGFTLKSWGFIQAYKCGNMVHISVFGFVADNNISATTNCITTTFNMKEKSVGSVNIANDNVTAIRVTGANTIVIEDTVIANTNLYANITVFLA